MSRRAVPSIAELRDIAQSSKSDQRFIYRVFRIISIRITWVLLHTPVTANQVTVISLLVGVAGLVFLALSDPLTALVGCGLLIVYHILDRVDGEVARFRKKHSLYGIYLDNLGHYVTGAGLLIALAYRLAPAVSDPGQIWLAGSVSALAAMLVRVEKHAPYHLFSQYIIDHPELLGTIPVTSGTLTRNATEADRSGEGATSPLGIIREVLLTLTWFPITVLLVAIGLAVEAVTGSVNPTIWIFLVVAGLQLVVWVGIEVANLTQNLGAESRRLAKRVGLTGYRNRD